MEIRLVHSQSESAEILRHNTCFHSLILTEKKIINSTWYFFFQNLSVKSVFPKFSPLRPDQKPISNPLGQEWERYKKKPGIPSHDVSRSGKPGSQSVHVGVHHIPGVLGTQLKRGSNQRLPAVREALPSVCLFHFWTGSKVSFIKPFSQYLWVDQRRPVISWF